VVTCIYKSTPTTESLTFTQSPTTPPTWRLTTASLHQSP
jgi:hypothetical protein